MTSRFFFPFLLLIVLSLGSCSFFSSVGDSISSGYQNTVAYFNSYYNAKRAFDDAESEIIAADELVGLRGFSEKPPPIQAAVRQKLTTVIDKCSNILQFYPSSALIDDALMLIGKSYFYQTEYLKAERKFTEFLAGYPDSPLNREARLWYFKTLARLKKDAQAAEAGEALLADAKRDEDAELSAEVADVLGIVYERANRQDKSMEMYSRVRELSGDNEMRAWAYYREGEKLVALGRNDEAGEKFRLAAENSDNIPFQSRSLLEHIRTLRSVNRNDEALRAANAMFNDYRFGQYTKEILFERGKTYAGAGKINEAVDDLVKVDTTAGRTELGSRASFELGKLYEYEWSDYTRARDAYLKSTNFPVTELLQTARRKHTGFTRYFALTDARRKRDSLITKLSDNPPADSILARANITNIDSLRSAQMENSYEMGELFYADIENPDSAVYWYKDALKGVTDSVRTPRINYIIAELALSNPERGYGDGKTIMQSIIDNYPKSVYAMRSRIQLGIPLEASEKDEGEVLFKRAEATIDSGNYGQAITTLKKISSEYPMSPFAAKSVYTAGWLYENRMAQPDSAMDQYKTLVQTYTASPYAAAVRRKVLAGKATTDTTASPIQRQEKKKLEQ